MTKAKTFKQLQQQVTSSSAAKKEFHTRLCEMDEYLEAEGISDDVRMFAADIMLGAKQHERAPKPKARAAKAGK
jgi:hypothetical protein